MNKTLYSFAFISMTAFGADTAGPSVTFTKDVLPILQANCQECHRPGQAAPMSLLTYETTRPWAKAMKAAVLSRKMPPWFADPQYGHFKNDRSLKQSDIQTIAKWADTGAPLGDPKDAPAAIQWPDGGWQVKPDVIVEGPVYDVPAKAVVEWTWVPVPSGFTKDTWVTSVEVKTETPQVTHHICLSFRPHTPDVQYGVMRTNRQNIDRDAEGVETLESKLRSRQQTQTAQRDAQAGRRGGPGGIEECYEPGRPAADFRIHNAAKLIPAGTDIWINLHYTPNGTPVKDHVQIGFTVAKEEPQRRYLAMSTSSPSDPEHFAIPPNDPNWESPPAVVTFNQDAELVGLMPHMHLRGKDMLFQLEYPDGKKETIMNVPHYDFNWQLWYDTSIKVPKGTKMTVIAHYDNSANNKFNPNPNRTVYYGDQTWEEMMFPSYGLIVSKDTDPKKVVSNGNRVSGEGGPQD
jgi:hypothetical protein